MVAHQAVGMDLKPGLLASFCQRLEKILPVHIVQIDVLLAVPAAHDVVNGPRILDSELSRHGREPAPGSNCCQREKLWFDPFTFSKVAAVRQSWAEGIAATALWDSARRIRRFLPGATACGLQPVRKWFGEA